MESLASKFGKIISQIPQDQQHQLEQELAKVMPVSHSEIEWKAGWAYDEKIDFVRVHFSFKIEYYQPILGISWQEGIQKLLNVSANTDFPQRALEFMSEFEENWFLHIRPCTQFDHIGIIHFYIQNQKVHAQQPVFTPQENS